MSSRILARKITAVVSAALAPHDAQRVHASRCMDKIASLRDSFAGELALDDASRVSSHQCLALLGACAHSGQ